MALNPSFNRYYSHIRERLRRKSFENVSVVSEWPCERDFGVLATENRVRGGIDSINLFSH